ncbi:MAG: hypothetical protein R6V60_06315, partial [Desulfobacterales bacterium]
ADAMAAVFDGCVRTANFLYCLEFSFSPSIDSDQEASAFMKDERGLYYYPNPGNKQFRTYVRRAEGTFWFRLYNAEDPELWAQHGWIPWEAIQQAAAIYQGDTLDPLQAYDIELAKALLDDTA